MNFQYFLWERFQELGFTKTFVLGPSISCNSALGGLDLHIIRCFLPICKECLGLLVNHYKRVLRVSCEETRLQGLTFVCLVTNKLAMGLH